MVLTQTAHIIRERGDGEGGSGKGSLDYYRITDRFASQSRKNAEIAKKKGNDQQAPQTSEGRDFLSSLSTTRTKAAEADGVTDLGALCPNPIPFRRNRVDEATGEVVSSEFVKKGCNKKSCPVCGPVLRKRLVGHFSRVFSVLPRLAFVTLTLDPKCGVSAEDSRKYMVYSWSKFRKRLNRRGDFQFVAALESHKSGYTHMHVLCSLPDGVGSDDLRSAWFAVGGGVVMDIQAVTEEPEKTVGYVVKYVLKDADKGSGRRSMLCSQGVSYYSERHRSERREYAERIEERKRSETKPDEVESPDSVVSDVWEPLVEGVRKGSDDTPTREDIARFRPLSKSLNRTTLYIHDRVDGARILAYYDPQIRGVREQMIPGEMTRGMLSKEIARIRRMQSAEGTK